MFGITWIKLIHSVSFTGILKFTDLVFFELESDAKIYLNSNVTRNSYNQFITKK